MNCSQSQTILFVDDDPAIRFLLEKRFVSWDFQVKTAETGRQAKAFIQSGCPDVIVTDLFMPEGDGFGLLHHLQQTAPELPVIVMSGRGGLDDVIRALRLGAWDYLHKPIEKLSSLRLTVERAMEKARRIEKNRAYCHHLEDLVAQKSAELNALKDHYQTVIDFTYDWEYWVAPHGDIVYMSPACKRITGYSPHEFCEQPSIIREIIHPQDRDRFDRHFCDPRFDKQAYHIDFRITRRDGELRWIGHCCQPVSGRQGKYLGRRCSNRDITYQKKIEKQLLDQRQALIEKTINQEKANEALRTILEQREIEKKAIEQSMVSNLRRFVFPYLDELERLKTGATAQSYVKIIRTNVEQLISPVSKSLSSAYRDLTPTEIKVADLVRQEKSTKSIAAVMNISPSTVEKHRNKIRKKLNILNKKINLHTYLSSLN